MLSYERLFPVALLACVAVGAWCFAHADAVTASQDFLAAGFGLAADDGLRRLRRGAPGPRWQRQRTPT